MRGKCLFPIVTYPEVPRDWVAARAVATAGALDLDMHVLGVVVDIPDVSSALSRLMVDVPEMIRGAEAASRSGAKDLMSMVAAACSKAGIAATTATVGSKPALMGETAANHARYFDLALVAIDPENAMTRMTAEAIVFGSGRPTIMIPESPAGGAATDIAIAWDGSRAAARAVADASALIGRAARISVLSVTDDKPMWEAGARRLADSLRDRGLDAEAIVCKRGGRPIGETLQDRAVELGAGLLVMGGYGHSRLREFVLGGATQGVLDAPRIPILMSH